MVKKVQKTADYKKPSAREDAAATKPTAALLDTQFGQLVKDSAQQIWSAGLAAFAKAQDNGGKVLDTLSAEGAKLQKKAKAGAGNAEDKLGAVARSMTDMAGEVGSRAGQHWDKLESIFEDRVARALKRLGMPSAQELQALSDRIDALSAALAAQSGGATTKGTAQSASKAKSKPAARTAPVKSPATKTVAKSAKPAAKKIAAKQSAAKTSAVKKTTAAKKAPAKKTTTR